MVIEQFSKKMVKSGIFDTYVAAVFFSSIIFFVLNATIFTPLEMMFGIVISTIFFKGLANMMLSLTISLVSLDNQQDRVKFKRDSENLESLVNDLALQEAAIQSSKNINNKG
ncbi:MAG: hypothetical protein CSA86_03185 [Arcobacter sp.]|nr:MAG: hypothetical protein CSA86_03185 [Arcobacter sp.]